MYYYGNGEECSEEVPWLAFTEDYCPVWSVRWAETYKRTIPEAAAYLSNRPLTQAEYDWPSTPEGQRIIQSVRQ